MSTQPHTLLGKAKKAFQKAVIGGLLVTSMVAGFGANTAQAQTWNQGGVTVSQTQQQQVQQQKPWANDPAYVEQLQLMHEQSALRQEQFDQKLQQGRAFTTAWMTRELNKIKQQHDRQAARTQGGLNKFALNAQSGTAANSIMARYNAQMKTYDIQDRQNELNERQAMINATAKLDLAYSRISPYREILAEQAQQRAAEAAQYRAQQQQQRTVQQNPR